MTTVFAVFYGCVMTVSMCSWQIRRITLTQHCAVMTVLGAVAMVAYAFFEWTLVGYLNAASTALHAWAWWHGGGGDGTRRRLKKWGRRFQGVRRTAPTTA
jgi:hypothetical protein